METNMKPRNTTIVKNIIVLISIVMGFAFTPAAFAQSGNVYGSNQVQTIANAEEGVVLQVAIRQAEASWQAKAGGATGGGMVGALLGNSLGGNYQTKALLGALGALGGGFAGQRVANAMGGSDAQEIVVGIRDPRSNSISRVVTVVQPSPFDAVAPGDNVLVVNASGAVRIIKRTYGAETVQR